MSANVSLVELPKWTDYYESEELSHDYVRQESDNDQVQNFASLPTAESRVRTIDKNTINSLRNVAQKCSLGLAIIGWGLALLNSPAPRSLTVECVKKFALGCGIGLGYFPLNFAIGQLVLAIIPEEMGRDEETKSYCEAQKDYSSMVMRAPLEEETFFRGAVQEGILLRGIRYGMQALSLGSETMLHSTTGKASRIGAAALLFGMAHLLNGHSAARHQMISSIFSGILLGALKESRLGLAGAIGAHMINNACAAALLLRSDKIRAEIRRIQDERDALQEEIDAIKREMEKESNSSRL